jgi:hypothetical protein
MVESVRDRRGESEKNARAVGIVEALGFLSDGDGKAVADSIRLNAHVRSDRLFSLLPQV